jgi:hypothetical protein
VLITTVLDPHEKDRFYEGIETLPTDTGYETPGGSFSEELKNQTEQDEGREYGTPTWRNLWRGVKPFNPFFLLTDARGKTPDYDPKVTWLKYEQDYEIIEENGNVPIEGLADMDQEYYQNPQLVKGTPTNSQGFLNDADFGYANPSPGAYLDGQMPPNATGAFIHGRNGTGNFAKTEIELDEIENTPEGKTPPTADVITQRRTYSTKPTRFYLVVRGVAVRVKHKIPLPQVLSIAGQPATRVGTGRYKHKNIAPDADLPVYMAMWEQVYTVDKSILSEDILDQIVDTGASMMYV